MPWGIGKRESCPASKPWAVWLKATGEVVRGGCHATREQALAHQRALYAQESAAYPLKPGEEPVMREHLIAPVLEWKAAGSTGELEGYASVFGNVDQGGDVVLPGAFRKTLADWARSKQPLPLIADHDLSTKGVIGSVKQAREDSVGLWIRAGFSSVPEAQGIRTKMIEGHLKGMSFTYETVRHRMGQVAGKSARFLEELKLFEATVTPFPMNTLAIASAKVKKPYGDVPYADPGYLDADGNQVSKSGKEGVARYAIDAGRVMAAWSYINQADNASQYTAEQLALIKGRIRTAMKEHGHQVSEAASLDFARFSDGMRSALAIPFEAASKAAADILVAAYLDDAAVLSDEQATADAAAATPYGAAGTAEDKSAYALQFITAPSEPPDGALATLTPLEVARTSADLDRVEAQINQKLGRTTQ